MNHILVGGENFDILAPIILWNEPKGKSFYKIQKSYLPRNWNLQDCRNKLDCCVLHHADTISAEVTYQVLIQRGLSCNFIIDDDNIDGLATIYQCLDVKDAGFSQKSFNHRGPGIEVSYRALVNDAPNVYSKENQEKLKTGQHEVGEDFIHGAKLKVYKPSKAQVNSLIELCRALQMALPAIDWQFQKDLQGKIIKTTLSNPSGLCCHYHLDRGKIDPVGMPLEMIENSINSKDIYDS